MAATLEAVAVLKRETGISRVALVGQGLGAAIAYKAAAGVADLDRLVLLAPVVRGRAWLRELSAWGGMVAEAMALPRDLGGVAGYAMPSRLAGQVERLDLLQTPAPDVPVLVAAPPARALDRRLATRLGPRAELICYDGYEDLLTSPTAAPEPGALVEAVTAWLDPVGEGRSSRAAAMPRGPAVLAGAGFVEEAVRIDEGGLFGVLCRPAGARPGATVLMLNAGRDPHEGWARSAVMGARALARDGVATLRFDCAGIGDSPPREAAEGAPYSPGHRDDVRAALDFLSGRGLGPVVAVGRCSGAHLAIAAAGWPEVRAAILANPEKLVVSDDAGTEADIDGVDYYRDRLRPAHLLRRMLRGDLNVGRASWRLLGLGARLALKRVAGRAPAIGPQLSRRLRVLRDEDRKLLFLFGDRGGALQTFRRHCGVSVRNLQALSNVEVAVVAGADDCFTSPFARDALLDHVRRYALDGRAA